jgi:hypothetical protein
MAFVYRSSRENITERNRISLGPGEYDEEFSKTQGRLLHKNSMKYSTIIKNTKKPLIIPFNTTSQRSKLFEGGSKNPGPGTYSLTNNFNCINQNGKIPLLGRTSSSLDKDLQDIIPKLQSNLNISKKGFLSSERRFNKKSSNETILPGPGSYDLRTFFKNKNMNNSNKFMKEKYAINKGRIYKLPGSNQIITSIPDKNKGEFKIVKGLLTEFKKEKYNEGIVGPGKYNIYTNWNTHGVVWDKGFKKEDKSKINESEIQKELEQNSSMFNNENYSEKMHNYNLSSISTNFNYTQKSKNMSSILTNTNINTSKNNYNNSNNININVSGWNTTSNLNFNNSLKNIKPQIEGQIRNRIFHNFLKSREDLHYSTMSKLKDPNNLILDVQYTDRPGPGFYNQNIIPKRISFTSTAQNFGSSSPKFKILKTENDILGPGTYFKEKNKYEPKFKTVLHAKIPEKQKREGNESVYVQDLIRNNEEKQPGPGEYNLEGQFIKKEISNNKSFGSSVERFNFKKTVEQKEENLNNSNIREYINQSLDEENKKEKERIKEIKYLKKVEKIKKKEKIKRQKYIKKKMPSVGTYSPEMTSSLYYQVLSKLNPYRNQVAPFDMVNSRFAQIKNPRIKNAVTPGPADYNVLPAFKALNLDKRKYNIFGQNKQRESRIKNTFVPGPGLYNLDNPDIWNIKSYNVLFINNK